MIQRVLLIERDPDIQELATIALEWNGYQVVSAITEIEALKQLSAPDEEWFAILAADLYCGKDSLSWAREVRKRNLKVSKLIVLTHESDCRKRKSELSTLDAVSLEKPFSLWQLVKILKP